MLKDAFYSGLFKAKWIGCDSLFGASKTFSDSLPRECYYFADIHAQVLNDPNITGIPSVERVIYMLSYGLRESISIEWTGYGSIMIPQ